MNDMHVKSLKKINVIYHLSHPIMLIFFGWSGPFIRILSSSWFKTCGCLSCVGANRN